MPPIGSRWQECDNRFTRTVEVMDHHAIDGKVLIKNVDNGRVSWAKASRFNGKSGGYVLLVRAS